MSMFSPWQVRVFRLISVLALTRALFLTPAPAAEMSAAPVKVKVFVATMFEIGEIGKKSPGSRAGEFQHWYDRY